LSALAQHLAVALIVGSAVLFLVSRLRGGGGPRPASSSSTAPDVPVSRLTRKKRPGS
jgi:hypothetical protein